MVFKNRKVAANLLAEQLKHVSLQEAVVLAIPRGGVPIGYEIAKDLELPLEVFLSKKIGHPLNPEYAVGSVTLVGWTIDRDHAEISEHYISDQVEKIQPGLMYQYKKFMGTTIPQSVSGKTVILVDDGVATGSTLSSAIRGIRQQQPLKIIVAVPVAARPAYEQLKQLADAVFCLLVPDNFIGVSHFYKEFEQVSDDQVVEQLSEWRNLSSGYRY